MSDQAAEIVIAGAARTPMGAFQGELAPLSAPELGGGAIAGAIRNAGVDAAAVDEVIMGCVLPAGVGQAPARQAGFAAGLGEDCLLYTSPSPRDRQKSRMPSSA